MNGAYRGKRALDVLAAGAGALAALPAMSAIAVAIKLTSKGPVLYWSERVGQDNRIFRMPKFRTMRTDTPAVASALSTPATTTPCWCRSSPSPTAR